MWDLNSGHGTVNMRPCSTMFGMYVNEDKIKNLRTFLCAVITTRDSGTKVKMQILNMAYFNCFIYIFFFFFFFQPDLFTSDEGVAEYKGSPLVTTAGQITTSLKNAQIS